MLLDIASDISETLTRTYGPEPKIMTRGCQHTSIPSVTRIAKQGGDNVRAHYRFHIRRKSLIVSDAVNIMRLPFLGLDAIAEVMRGDAVTRFNTSHNIHVSDMIGNTRSICVLYEDPRVFIYKHEII
jgi:hypothetical protein